MLVIVIGVTAAGGLGILTGGGGPSEPVHFIYALVALALVPVADSLARRNSPRTQAAVAVVAAILSLIVLVRLAQTG